MAAPEMFQKDVAASLQLLFAKALETIRNPSLAGAATSNPVRAKENVPNMSPTSFLRRPPKSLPESDNSLSAVAKATLPAMEGTKPSSANCEASTPKEVIIIRDDDDDGFLLGRKPKQVDKRYFYNGRRYNLRKDYGKKLVTITLSNRKARGRVALEPPTEDDKIVHRLYSEGKTVMSLILLGCQLDFEEMEQDWNERHKEEIESRRRQKLARRSPSVDSLNSLASFCEQQTALPIEPIREAITPPPRTTPVRKRHKPQPKNYPQYAGPIRVVTKAALKSYH